jgi:hypothetical protein
MLTGWNSWGTRGSRGADAPTRKPSDPCKSRSNAGPIGVRAEGPSVTCKRAFLNHANYARELCWFRAVSRGDRRLLCASGACRFQAWRRQRGSVALSDQKCWGLHPSLDDAAASAAEESRQLTVLLVIRRNKKVKGLNGECVRSRPTFHRARARLSARGVFARLVSTVEVS